MKNKFSKTCVQSSRFQSTEIRFSDGPLCKVFLAVGSVGGGGGGGEGGQTSNFPLSIPFNSSSHS